MFKGRSVYLAVAVVALFAFGVASALEDTLVFVSPKPSSILIGEVAFEFDVSEVGSKIDRIDVFVGGRLIGSASPGDWKLSWNAGEEHVGQTVIAIGYRDGAPVVKGVLETMAIASGVDVEVRRVQHYPVVTDRGGRYVAGLTIDDFVVLDGGKEVQIDEFSTGEAPLVVALVLDISRSMEGLLGLVQAAACRFVDRLGRHDRVGVYAFNQGVVRLSGFDCDFEAAKDGIRSLRSTGGTALYDALRKVLGDLKSVRGRKAIFLFSDGRDESSAAALPQIVQTARLGDALIYAVSSANKRGDSGGRDDLLALAEATGGKAWFVRRPREIEAVYAEVLRELRSQYIISYRPPPGPAGWRRVEIRTRRPGLKVRHRKSYMHRE